MRYDRLLKLEWKADQREDEAIDWTEADDDEIAFAEECCARCATEGGFDVGRLSEDEKERLFRIIQRLDGVDY